MNSAFLRKLPIEGVPAIAPLCPGCGAKLKPVFNYRYQDGTIEIVPFDRPIPVVAKTFVRWNAYRGLFHSLRCALKFACAAHLAGYRMKGVKP